MVWYIGHLPHSQPTSCYCSPAVLCPPPAIDGLPCTQPPELWSLTVSPPLAFELYLYYQRSARDYRGRVTVVPVMVIPGIIVGRDWQVVAYASDPIARDHDGRDQSMIVLPGIIQPGIEWRIIGPHTNKKVGPENDWLVSSGVVSPGCVCVQCWLHNSCISVVVHNSHSTWDYKWITNSLRSIYNMNNAHNKSATDVWTLRYNSEFQLKFDRTSLQNWQMFGHTIYFCHCYREFCKILSPRSIWIGAGNLGMSFARLKWPYCMGMSLVIFLTVLEWLMRTGMKLGQPLEYWIAVEDSCSVGMGRAIYNLLNGTCSRNYCSIGMGLIVVLEWD